MIGVSCAVDEMIHWAQQSKGVIAYMGGVACNMKESTVISPQTIICNADDVFENNE